MRSGVAERVLSDNCANPVPLGYKVTIRTEYVSSRGTCIDVILEEGGTLVVKVKDEAGAALAGAKVSAQAGPSWGGAVTA